MITSYVFQIHRSKLCLSGKTVARKGSAVVFLHEIRAGDTRKTMLYYHSTFQGTFAMLVAQLQSEQSQLTLRQ
jgi:hypothetical protein